MPRPSDSPFDWASDGVHSDPGEVWDGQPSVVVPSAGKVAAGMLPNEVLPAEYFNEIVRRNSAWLTFLQELTAPREIVIPGGAFQIVTGSALERQLGSAYTGFVSGMRGQVLACPSGSGPLRAYLDLSPYLHIAPMAITSVRITGAYDDDASASLTLVRRDPLATPTAAFLTSFAGTASDPSDTFDTGLVGPFLIPPLDGGTTNELELELDANAGSITVFDVTIVVAP